METNPTKPISTSVYKAMLLCFLPATTPGESLQERADLLALAQRLQQRLPELRVLTVDQLLHPEVVRSFHLQQLPALVLVQEGVERWRKEGMLPGEELALTSFLLDQSNGL